MCESYQSKYEDVLYVNIGDGEPFYYTKVSITESPIDRRGMLEVRFPNGDTRRVYSHELLPSTVTNTDQLDYLAKNGANSSLDRAYDRICDRICDQSISDLLVLKKSFPLS